MSAWQDFCDKYPIRPTMYVGDPFPIHDPVPSDERWPWARRIAVLGSIGGSLGGADEVKCYFDPQFNTFHFIGRGESWNMDLNEPADVEHAVSTFDNYCHAAGRRPAYHHWCRRVVAECLHAAICHFYEQHLEHGAARASLQLLQSA